MKNTEGGKPGRDEVDRKTPKLRQSPWVTILAIFVCAVSGWTCEALAAFCWPGPDCVQDIPVAMIGGVLFAPLALSFALVVVLVTRMLRGVITPLTFAILVILTSAFGFLFGMAPGIHNNGP